VNRRNTDYWQNIGKLSKNHFISVSVKDLCMHRRMVSGDLRTKVHEIRGTISATPPAAALAPGSWTDWLQAGRPDVQDPLHLHTGLPQPSHPTSHRHSSASLFCCATSLQTDYQNQLRCSAFAVWNSLTADTVDSCSLTTFKRKLKTFLFRHAFSSS